MWYHILLAFCCCTVAVTASERSPAKVRIHHERSTQAELIASVEALGKTHHLKLKKTLMPSVPVQEMHYDDNGTVTIIDISGNEMRNYYENEETGAFLFMNNENTLEGMISDSVALHYDNNEHTISEVNEKTASPFCDVSHDKNMVDLSKHIESSKLLTESKAVSYVVEVFVVADSPLTNYKGGSANLADYMQVYWKMVDRRFKTVTGGSITIKLCRIKCCSTTACDRDIMGATELNQADLYASKEQFAKYLATQTFSFDVGHLMTKRDLFVLENGNRYREYTGIAFVGLPCYIVGGYAYNSGMSEDDGSYHGTLTTAHEIGHHLGAPHDGEGSSASCPHSDGYIMSHVRNSYKTFLFSSCSSAAMLSVYSKGTSGCLQTIDMPTIYVYPNYIAGTFDNFDRQCASTTGIANAIADRTVSANDQCFLLRCTYVSGGTTVSAPTRYPAHDGTPCSSTTFCKDGSCQTSWM